MVRINIKPSSPGKASDGKDMPLAGKLFTTAFLLIFVFMTILPRYRTAMSQSWTSVPCVIERSDVLRFEGDDAPTCRTDILYNYDIGVEQIFERVALRDERDFRFPGLDGPYSFSGRLITVGWLIKAYAERGDAVAEQALTLSPTGREVRI